jgi:methionyl-tRNA formyltransferase
MQKISLFLMTKKGYITLKSIIEAFTPSVINCVISAKDENIQEDYYEEIKKLCKIHNILFLDRKHYNEVDSLYLFAVSWRWLIKMNNNQHLIVFHDSLLPKYRGFAPLVNSLINGEEEIGVTALFANEEYDRGNIIAQRKTKIEYPIRIQEAIELNNSNYISLTLGIIETLQNGKSLISYAQDENLATYSLWRDEEDYKIDWSLTSFQIHRFINAVGFPYKGASATLESQKVRIYEAEIVEDVQIENRDIGKIIFLSDQYPVVVCGKGLIKLTNIVKDENRESVLPLKKFRCRFR